MYKLTGWLGGALLKIYARHRRAEIDSSLSRQNADYRTKRTNNIAIASPEVIIVAPGTFSNWMAGRDKVGGQHKVPRVTTADQLDDIIGHRP